MNVVEWVFRNLLTPRLQVLTNGSSAFANEFIDPADISGTDAVPLQTTDGTCSHRLVPSILLHRAKDLGFLIEKRPFLPFMSTAPVFVHPSSLLMKRTQVFVMLNSYLVTYED